jgi:hypothetical protein
LGAKLDALTCRSRDLPKEGDTHLTENFHAVTGCGLRARVKGLKSRA